MKNKLETIQALRGLAAFLVVVTHVAGTLSPHFINPSWLVSSKLYWLGGIGVDIFFCISGFIMFYTFDGRVGIIPSLKFFSKRILRIYPIYIIFSLWCLYFIKPQYLNDAAMVIDSLLLTAPTMSTGHPHLIIGQGWTLQYEMYFYIIFSLTILITNKLYFVAIVIALIYAITNFNPDFLGPYGNMTSNAVVFDFLLGMGVSWIYKRSSIFNSIKLNPLFCCLFIFALLSISCYLSVFMKVQKLYSFGFISCLILMVALFSSFSKSRFGSFFVFIGEASYTTYLIHLLPLGFIISFIRAYDLHDINADVFIMLSTLFITALSLVLYVLLEKNIAFLTSGLFKKTTGKITDAKRA